MVIYDTAIREDFLVKDNFDFKATMINRGVVYCGIMGKDPPLGCPYSILDSYNLSPATSSVFPKEPGRQQEMV